MIGAAGISAFPMASRVVHKIGLAEDNQNHLLMHAAGVRTLPDRSPPSSRAAFCSVSS